MAARLMLLSILFGFASLATGREWTSRRTYTPVQYFKNYALSTCLADGFTAEETVKDAAAAARGYLELGEFALEAHTKATQLGRQFLAREYKSVSGEKLTLMKCIDFFHSPELDRLAKKSTKH
jgi:hypothetical protein